MSTAIDVYPTVNALPLVEEIRGRTQELFQTLLNRHGIGSTIEVIAFYPSPSKLPIKDVEKDTVWTPDLYLGFEYLIDGIWDSNSWHSCLLSKLTIGTSSKSSKILFPQLDFQKFWHRTTTGLTKITLMALLLPQPVTVWFVQLWLKQPKESSPHLTANLTKNTTPKPLRSFLPGGATGKSISMARTHSEIHEGRDTN